MVHGGLIGTVAEQIMVKFTNFGRQYMRESAEGLPTVTDTETQTIKDFTVVTTGLLWQAGVSVSVAEIWNSIL